MSAVSKFDKIRYSKILTSVCRTFIIACPLNVKRRCTGSSTGPRRAVAVYDSVYACLAFIQTWMDHPECQKACTYESAVSSTMTALTTRIHKKVQKKLKTVKM